MPGQLLPIETTQNWQSIPARELPLLVAEFALRHRHFVEVETGLGAGQVTRHPRPAARLVRRAGIDVETPRDVDAHAMKVAPHHAPDPHQAWFRRLADLNDLPVHHVRALSCRVEERCHAARRRARSSYGTPAFCARRQRADAHQAPPLSLGTLNTPLAFLKREPFSIGRVFVGRLAQNHAPFSRLLLKGVHVRECVLFEARWNITGVNSGDKTTSPPSSAPLRIRRSYVSCPACEAGVQRVFWDRSSCETDPPCLVPRASP